MERSRTLSKCDSATRMLGILLANKNSNSVDTNGQWEFTYSGYAVGDGQIQGLSSDAVMDTGASLLYLDELIADAYYEQVPGAALDPTLYAWTFPCSASLPSLTLSIGGYNAVVPGTYMNSYPVTPEGKWSTVSLSNDRLANLFN
jgi:hypothetical protein